MTDWQDIERMARQLEESYAKNKLNMYYSERMAFERDIRELKEKAREEKDAYIRWLWGY